MQFCARGEFDGEAKERDDDGDRRLGRQVLKGHPRHPKMEESRWG